MSLVDENNGVGATMLVQPSGYSGGGNGFGNTWGDGGFWIILLFLLLLGGNGWGNGYGANGGGTTYVTNDLQRGFDQASLTNGINGISSSICNGFSNVQQSLCNGFAGVNQTVSNGFAQAEIANNARQMADMQQQFALQSQLAQCCCDNRLATSQLQNVVQTEACADRSAISDALRDVIASNTANTQAILDKLCQQELDAVKSENENLRTQLNMATLRESQTAQNAFIAQGLSNEVDALYNRLNNCPVPTTPVYGRTPIFTCNNNNNGCGCGCGMAA